MLFAKFAEKRKQNEKVFKNPGNRRKRYIPALVFDAPVLRNY